MDFIAFDLETTGTVAGVDRIVELGAVRFRAGVPEAAAVFAAVAAVSAAADHPALGLTLVAFTEVMAVVTEVMAVLSLSPASAAGVVVLDNRALMLEIS
jgi:DNA polymerase III epsilon subunit-like protein